MRMIIVECRDSNSADYWWRHTLDILYKEYPDLKDNINYLYKKYPQRRIHFTQFELYFIPQSQIYMFIKSRHVDENYMMNDTKYEKLMNDFENKRRELQLHNEL